MLYRNDNTIGYNNESDEYYTPHTKPDGYCTDCGQALYTGCDIYDIDGDIYCEDCGEDKLKEMFKKEMRETA